MSNTKNGNIRPTHYFRAFGVAWLKGMLICSNSLSPICLVHIHYPFKLFVVHVLMHLDAEQSKSNRNFVKLGDDAPTPEHDWTCRENSQVYIEDHCGWQVPDIWSWWFDYLYRLHPGRHWQPWFMLISFFVFTRILTIHEFVIVLNFKLFSMDTITNQNWLFSTPMSIYGYFVFTK